MRKLMLNRFVFLVAILFWSISAMAQADLIFSNANTNNSLFNPSAIEDNGLINIHMLARQQWIGFPDAPSAQYASVSNFFEEQPMGLRLAILNQTAGKETTRNIGLAYAYRVQFSNELFMNFGLSAGLYQRIVRFSELIYQTGNEPLIKQDEQVVKPDFSFGLTAFWKNFTFGLAANHITTPNRKATIFKIPVHNHLFLQYRTDLNTETQLFSELAFHQIGSIQYLQADIHLFFRQFDAGMAFRAGDAIVVKAGIKVNDALRIAYAFDIGINKIANYNSGSHEFMVVLSLQKKSAAYLSPRFLD